MYLIHTLEHNISRTMSANLADTLLRLIPDAKAYRLTPVTLEELMVEADAERLAATQQNLDLTGGC